MEMKIFPVFLIVTLFVFGTAVKSLSTHEEEKGTVKGTVTDIKAVEVELTVKDERGKETKVRTKDPSAFKLADRVVIKNGKVMKEVKPITGGY
jgi:hypothetical protein